MLRVLALAGLVFLAPLIENLLYLSYRPRSQVFNSSDERPLTKRTKALTVPILILLKVLALLKKKPGTGRTWRLLKTPTAQTIGSSLDG